MNIYSNLPLVSVSIPVYGRAEMLSLCLNSVINQSYKNLEIIIIYTCHPDNSLEICKNFAAKDSRIRIIYFNDELNTLSPHLRKAAELGFNKSQGKYLCTVDSDDYIDPICIEECVKAIGDYGLIYTYCKQFGDVNTLDNRALYSYSKERLIEFFMVFHFRMFLKLAWDNIGSLTNLTYLYDYDLVLRLSEVVDFVLLPKVLYYWRRHKDQNLNINSLELKRYEMNLCRLEAKKRRGLI